MNTSNSSFYNSFNTLKDDSIVHKKENKTPEINKKIKFSIRRKEKEKEKSQVVIFNNFNIKDINGRKEIILNRIRVPKSEYNKNNFDNSNNNLYSISNDSNTIKFNKVNGEDDNDETINNSEPILNLKGNTKYNKDQKISNSYQELSLDTIINKKKRKKSKNKNDKKEIEDRLTKLINKYNLILIKEKYFIPWFNKAQHNFGGVNKNKISKFSKINNKTTSKKKKYNYEEEDDKDDKDDYDYKTKAHSTQTKRKNKKQQKTNYLNNNNLKTTIIENELKSNDKKAFIPINPKPKKNKDKIIEDINTTINNVKYVNREMRSNSRKIVIKQEPLDMNEEEEKIINKSYTTNEIKFNSSELKNEPQFKKIKPKKQKVIQSPINEVDSNKNETKSNENNKENSKNETKSNENNKENLKNEIKIIKNQKTNINSSEVNNENEEESSALMEDPSEVQTIYNFKNNTTNTPHQSKDAKSNTYEVIEEENDYYNSLLKQSINNLTKTNLLLPYIYKLSLHNNNAINKTLDMLTNCNAKLFKLINSEDYVKFLKKNQKIISAYQIYCLYCLFNKGKNFYRLKNRFTKWKKNMNIFNQNTINKHIRNKREQYLGTNYLSQQKDKNYCYCKKLNKSNRNNNYNCLCKLRRTILKKILIRQKFMKKINPKRYYLYLWYKNIYKKVRSINL
jgi:hypothetical protein